MLRPYQVECLRFLRQWNGRVLIGDAPGIGKTVEALSWLCDNPRHLPALVVCPASIKGQWEMEWSAWLPQEPVQVLSGTRPKRLPKGKSYILNWDILVYWAPGLSKMGIKTVVGDEIHKCGNPRAQRTKALSWLSKSIPYFIAMSGTPVQSRPGQFFPMLHMIDPNRFKSLRVFQEQYCNMRINRWSRVLEEAPGGKNLNELNKILADYMLRREKREVLADLPLLPPRTIVPLDLEDPKRYGDLELKTKAAVQTGNLLEGKSAIQSLRRSVFALKKKLVIAWIKDFLESGESLVVFAYHRAALLDLEEAFVGRCVRVDGSVTGGRRRAAVAAFMGRNVPLMVAQIDAMGEGVDGLQRPCSACAFVEFGKTAISHEQAESRLDRSGQVRGVNRYYLVARNTVDVDTMAALDAQTKMFDKLVRGVPSLGVNLLSEIYKRWVEKDK